MYRNERKLVRWMQAHRRHHVDAYEAVQECKRDKWWCMFLKHHDELQAPTELHDIMDHMLVNYPDDFDAYDIDHAIEVIEERMVEFTKYLEENNGEIPATVYDDYYDRNASTW